MITNQLIEQHITVRANHQDHSDISRLLAAAVVSRRFCNFLLTDPVGAISSGYAGEHFSLSTEEYALILSTRASTLPEFAQQLCKHFPAPEPIAKPNLSGNYQLRI